LKEGKTFLKNICKSYKSFVRFNIRPRLNIIFISSQVKGFFFTSKSTIILVCYAQHVLMKMPDSAFLGEAPRPVDGASRDGSFVHIVPLPACR
jgi:hypothetical protein